MSLKKGIVVATHTNDHSVDLVLVDNGARLVGVQVSTSACSSRSGSFDLPAVPEKSNKWDITQTTGQDIIALVDWVGRVPVVMGFLYPQINQMLSDDPLLKFSRHQSDVISYTDGDGNFGIQHPSGAFIHIGETVDKPDFAGANADKSLAVDRNTDKKVNIRLSLAGQVVDLIMSKDGNVTAKLSGNMDWEAGGSMTFKAGGGITMQAGGDIKSTAGGDNSLNGATVNLNS